MQRASDASTRNSSGASFILELPERFDENMMQALTLVVDNAAKESGGNGSGMEIQLRFVKYR